MAKQNNRKIVYAIRHGKQINVEGNGVWQPKAVLAPEADDQVAKAAAYFKVLGVEFDILRYSPLTRARQTCEKLQQKMGSTVVASECEKLGPTPAAIEEWDRILEAYWADPQNCKVIANMQIFEKWPKICTRDAGRVLEAINETAQKLEMGQTAAVVGHNPLLNIAQVLAGMGESADLKPLQAIAFHFDEHNDLVSCEAHLI